MGYDVENPSSLKKGEIIEPLPNRTEAQKYALKPEPICIGKQKVTTYQINAKYLVEEKSKKCWKRKSSPKRKCAKMLQTSRVLVFNRLEPAKHDGLYPKYGTLM